jgi:hypothetical protein
MSQTPDEIDLKISTSKYENYKKNYFIFFIASRTTEDVQFSTKKTLNLFLNFKSSKSNNSPT